MHPIDPCGQSGGGVGTRVGGWGLNTVSPYSMVLLGAVHALVPAASDPKGLREPQPAFTSNTTTTTLPPPANNFLPGCYNS